MTSFIPVELLGYVHSQVHFQVENGASACCDINFQFWWSGGVGRGEGGGGIHQVNCVIQMLEDGH